jgi:hypothetical protein
MTQKKFGPLIKEAAEKYDIDKVHMQTKHATTTERTSIY